MTNLSCRQVVVAIRGTFGQPVYSRKLDVQPEADYTITTADLKVGVYYLHVLGENGYGKAIKFVKQHLIVSLFLLQKCHYSALAIRTGPAFRFQ